ATGPRPASRGAALRARGSRPSSSGTRQGALPPRTRASLPSPVRARGARIPACRAGVHAVRLLLDLLWTLTLLPLPPGRGAPGRGARFLLTLRPPDGERPR